MPSKEVFIPRKDREQKGLDIVTLMGNKPTKGEVGIEIEVEGVNLPADDTPAPWVYHIDHSLRAPKEPGGMTAEYVLSKPLPFDEVPAALKKLWTKFKSKKSKLVDSNRTSVHVHLNVQNFFLNRLTSFCALYFIVEEILTEWCGEHRVGNLFCLRAKDATAIVTHLKNFIQEDGRYQIGEFMHYSALNANALKKYGSIEVRTLRGCSDPSVIIDWVEILERIYNLSEEYPDPREVCTALSSIGPAAFFESILGPKSIVVRQGVPMSDNQISDSIYEGVRIAQDLCYCRDWDLYKPVKLKPDVFGRKMQKVANKFVNHPPFVPGADDDLLQAMSQMQQASFNDAFPNTYQGLQTIPYVYTEEAPEEAYEPEPDWNDLPPEED